MTFGEKLRELRKAAGMTIRELSDRSGVPESTLYQYASGRRVPSFPIAVAIAKALGADANAFQNCHFGDAASD